jgi:hypothetical protein
MPTRLQGMYPDKKQEIENTLDVGHGFTVSDTFEDRPRDQMSNWVDARRRRLMVVEIYHREGQSWNRCVFHAGGILEAGPSPYLDEKKQPECAIVAMSCYVDRENNRVGVGRDMRSPQDEFNKRRSKLLHLLNNRQVQAMPNEMGQMAIGTDADTVRAEAAKPDGVLPPGWQPVALNDLTQGQFNLLTLAETELDRQGPNPAILARSGSNASGRSKQVDQQAGMTEDAVVYKGLHNWEIRMYRAMWNRCKQFWTAPDYIRVTDDEGSPQFIGINQPIPGPPQVVMGEGGMPQIQPSVLGYENALAELDVDIVLDVVPDTAALADEQFQGLVELAKMYGPQEVPFDDLLEVSSLPDKRKLIEKRKARAEEAGQMGQMGQQPTDADQLQALADAACAQVTTWISLGIDPAAGQAGVALPASAKKVGSASISRTQTAAQVQARMNAADTLCDQAILILRGAGLLSTRVWTY